MNWLYVSALLMAVTAAVHSIFGERRLIIPLLELNTSITQLSLARQVIRGAWHLTSVLMLLSAALVIWPDVPDNLVLTAAIVWLVSGLIDALYTRGKHIGWPLLTFAGASAIAGII